MILGYFRHTVDFIAEFVPIQASLFRSDSAVVTTVHIRRTPYSSTVEASLQPVMSDLNIRCQGITI